MMTVRSYRHLLRPLLHQSFFPQQGVFVIIHLVVRIGNSERFFLFVWLGFFGHFQHLALLEYLLFDFLSHFLTHNISHRLHQAQLLFKGESSVWIHTVSNICSSTSASWQKQEADGKTDIASCNMFSNVPLILHAGISKKRS